jgi:hypothetical protein
VLLDATAYEEDVTVSLFELLFIAVHSWLIYLKSASDILLFFDTLISIFCVLRLSDFGDILQVVFEQLFR